ncbi:MAG TPA: tyrosine--tRNA ligase [Candidatus Limnocylindria bacterium]|nr:tyrosine--tRNA ligase [Candidatus Limnocylindria bacterium]
MATARAGVSVIDQVQAIMYGAEMGDRELERAMADELTERIAESRRTGRPLRVYAGYDPSKPDLHLGHSITLRKLRLFQDFGHDVIFVVGTFTAVVGDASDRTSARPRRTAEEIQDAARTYAEQCYRILDRERTTVVYNGDWLSGLTLADVVSLASHFTVQQFLVRDNYRKRLDAGDPVGLQEFLYPLLQGYDAVHLRADVQIGATEQLFNIQAGRKLQTIFGQRPCVCITYPILVGTDGVMRMSKSVGNYVALAAPPAEQYGKVMSISDATMLQWVKYVTRWTPERIVEFTRQVERGETNPMDAKKALAREIVSMYSGEAAADEAQRHFESVHQRRELPEQIPAVEFPGPTKIVDVLTKTGAASSRSEARRLIAGRGVQLDEAVVEDPEHLVARTSLLRVGRRRFFTIAIADSPPADSPP